MCAVIISLATSRVSISQEPSPNVGLCMSIYFEIEKLKMKYEESVKKIDSEIVKAEENIKEANRLLAEIQKAKVYGTDKEKKDAIQAEPLANKALIKAKETKRILLLRRLEYLMELERLNTEEEKLSELCKKISSTKVGGLSRSCFGDVRISRDNEVNQCTVYSIIHEGERITTGSNGRAEIVLLNGRGRVILENDTSFIIRESGKDDQIVELIDGRIKVDIEESGSFMRRMKDWGEQKLKELKVWICRKYRRGEGCAVTPWAVIGPRGTSFIIDRKGDYEASIKVLEGSVEIDILDGKKTVLEARSEAVLYSDGTLDLKR